MRMHDVFHVSLLKPYDPTNHQVVPVPPSLTMSGQEEFEVRQIIGHRDITNKHTKNKGAIKRQYLVSWRGQDYSSNTWEPDAHLKNCPEKIKEYWENRLA